MALEESGLKLIADGVSAYLSDINKADKANEGFYKTLGDAPKHANGFQQVITGMLREVGASLVQFGIQGAKAIGGFVKDSIGLAGDFESGMLEFQSVAGKEVDTKGLEEFRDLFLQIGKELPVSTSDVQKAATEMIKGGIDPATIAAGGLRQNIQFAAAAMKGDLVKAAEISSKIMGGWAGVNATAAEKADFLTHATDMLAKAANASATDVEGLSQGIFNAQGIARTAGVSFDDLTTTLATLAPRFASSSEAGNSLKNMIARLQPTTDPATQAMQALGLWTESTGSAFYDAQGNFVGFEQAAELLQQSLIGLTKEQQAATLQQIFGNDAMGSAAALAELGAEGYRNMADALENANGVADSAALKQQGFNVSLDNVKGSVEALQITIGSFLLPVIGDLMDNYITPGINNLTAFAETFLKMVPAIAASNDPLQTFLNALKVAAPGLLDTIVAIEGVKDKIGVVVEYLNANVVPVLSDVAEWLKTNIPVAAKATADFWNDTLQPALAAVTDYLKTNVFPVLSDIAAWLKDTVPAAAKATADFWNDPLLPIIKKVNDYMQGTLFPTFKDLADKYIANVTKSSGDFATSWNTTMYPALQKVGGYMALSMTEQWAKIDVWIATVQKTGEYFAAFWNNVLMPGLQNVGSYLETNLTPFFNDFGTELDNQVGPAIRGVWEWVVSLTSGFEGASSAIQDNITWLQDLAKGLRELELPDWLKPGSPTPWEIGLRGIASALQGVVPGLSAMQAGIGEVGAQIADTFQSTDLVDVLTNLGEDIMGGFAKGIEKAWSGVEDIINSTADNVEDAFRNATKTESPSQRMVPIGQSIVQGIMQGMSDQWGGLTSLIGSLSADLIDEMESIAQQIQGVIADAFGATASIDRQLAANLDKMKDVLPQYKQFTEGALSAAAAEAQRFADPAQGAKYFALRSKQILEYAKLQKDLAEAETQADKDRIAQQMVLINAAQTAELSAFRANQQGQTDPRQDIANQINAIIAALADPKLKLTDEQLHYVDMLSAMLDRLGGVPAPGRAAGGPVAANTPYWVGENGPELFMSKIAGQIMAPQSQPMNAGAMGGNYSTTNSQSTTLHMPIYTNQSPSVMRDSMAIAGAALL